MAHTYLAGDKRPEAAALFARTEGRVAEARERLEDLPKGEADVRGALPRLASLAAKARAWRLVAAAEAVAEAAAAGEEARKGVAGLGLEQQQGAGGAVSCGSARAGVGCGDHTCHLRTLCFP